MISRSVDTSLFIHSMLSITFLFAALSVKRHEFSYPEHQSLNRLEFLPGIRNVPGQALRSQSYCHHRLFGKYIF